MLCVSSFIIDVLQATSVEGTHKKQLKNFFLFFCSFLWPKEAIYIY